MRMNEKRLAKEIRQGKNLEEHSREFQREFLNNYYENAMVLTMYRYYMLCDMFFDQEEISRASKWEELGTIGKEIRDAAEIVFGENEELNETAVKQGLYQARNCVTERMQVLTSYVDALNIYEYVLNRVEFRFKEAEPMEEPVFINQMVRYIFSIRDNVVINENIKEVLGQLPVRMTKNRFYELVRNSISIYEDGDKSALDGYLYMLRTSAMLDMDEGQEDYFAECRDFLDRLKQTEFSALSAEDYLELSGQLKMMAEKLTEKTNIYMAVQEVLNALCVCIEAREAAGKLNDFAGYGKTFVFHNTAAVITRLNQLITETEPEMPEELTPYLAALEGKQEALQKDTDMLDGMFGVCEEILPEEQKKTFHRMQKLLSASLFIDLEKEEEAEKADSQYLAQETDKLLDALSAFFQENQQAVNRAVMASTLNKMPVFFNSAEEVTEYIRNSLELCHDPSEKLASMMILCDMMEQV